MAYQSATWAFNLNALRLHALVIGVNNYPLSSLPTLKAAVSDANAFERYLIEDLRVPARNIRNLRDENATRSNIISALQSLQSDLKIHFGDAIVIYYAGHGATVPARPGCGTGQGTTQMILPSDFGPSIYGIPDKTIGVLLDSLAKVQGDNITVIFDCCFSGSGTHGDNSEEQTRGAQITFPLPPGLDEEILASNNRGTSIPERFLHTGLRSHVFLAASSSEERAKESYGWGYFTKALLDTLKSMRVYTITYTELMNHLPKLPTQNPQCEGYNRNRILFNTEETGNVFFHKVYRTIEGRYEIGVGEAYGITQRALFVVYPRRQDATSGPALKGYVKPLQIGACKTLLNVPPDMAAAISQSAVVLQVRAGVEEAFPIHISDKSKEILDGIVNRVRNEMKSYGMRDVVIVSNDGSAKLGLDLESDNTTNQLEVVLTVLDPSISQWGLSRIHHDSALPPSFNALFPVLSGAANFDWHLHRESRGIGPSQVDIKFTRLLEITKTILIPHGPNMIETGSRHGDNVVLIDVSEGAIYGIKLTNKMTVPLYVSVFYFDNSDLSIKALLESPVSTSQSTAEAPLKPQQSVTIGYGSSGFPPFEYFLKEGQSVDVGTLKFYFSTEAVDLMYIRQESPFGVRAGCVAGDIARGYGQMGRAVWGSIEVRIVQKDKIEREAASWQNIFSHFWPF